jgi:hypothetical protein
VNAKRLIFFLMLSALALGGVLLGVAFYLFRPLKAEAIVQDYLKAPGLSLKEAPYGVELFPQSPKALLAFYPGARVDPLAYAPVLAPVAQAGYLVVLLKVPSGIALLGKERALEAKRAHPGLPLVVGGHSLGGVAAAEVAAREGLPLLLFAAYPRRGPLRGAPPHPSPLRNRRRPPAPKGGPGKGQKASPRSPGGLHRGPEPRRLRRLRGAKGRQAGQKAPGGALGGDPPGGPPLFGKPGPGHASPSPGATLRARGKVG